MSAGPGFSLITLLRENFFCVLHSIERQLSVSICFHSLLKESS